MYQKQQRKEDNEQGAVDIGWADPVGAQRKKKRKLYQLKAKEVEDIVSAHLQDGEQQAAIASRFGISNHLVSHLVNRNKKTPLMEVKRQLK